MAGGRPREFDVDEALDAAVDVFHERGYAGASLTRLTAAMGVNRPSLYAAFGDKSQLFEAAVKRYAEMGMPLFEALEEEPDVRLAFEKTLRSLVCFFTKPGRPRGCLVATCRVTGPAQTPSAARVLASVHAAVAAVLEGRLRRAIDEGDLPAGEDPRALARYFHAQMQGFSAMARSGADREELLAAVSVAMRALPDPGRS